MNFYNITTKKLCKISFKKKKNLNISKIIFDFFFGKIILMKYISNKYIRNSKLQNF